MLLAEPHPHLDSPRSVSATEIEFGLKSELDRV